MKRWKWITLGVIGIPQFVQPDRTTAIVDPANDLVAVTSPPAKVTATLHQACYDCHSNETRYPWYAYVTPVNWWMQKSHVEHGRHHVNFNKWGSYNEKDREEIKEEAIKLLEKSKMPLKSYTWLHADARLTAEARKELATFFRGLDPDRH